MERSNKETPKEASDQLLKQKLLEAELVESGAIEVLDSNEARKKRRKAKKQFKDFIDNFGQKDLFPENK